MASLVSVKNDEDGGGMREGGTDKADRVSPGPTEENQFDGTVYYKSHGYI